MSCLKSALRVLVWRENAGAKDFTLHVAVSTWAHLLPVWCCVDLPDLLLEACVLQDVMHLMIFSCSATNGLNASSRQEADNSGPENNMLQPAALLLLHCMSLRPGSSHSAAHSAARTNAPGRRSKVAYRVLQALSAAA